MADSAEEMNEEHESEFVDEEEAEGGPVALAKVRAKLKKAVEEKQREEALMHHDREARITSDVIESLIPALDTLELALKHEKEGQGSGLEMIYKQFVNSLKQIGVEKYGAVGEKFIPHTHEALREVATDDEAKDHTVESVERSGYKVGERVIRPAQVSVYVYKN
jgi:molecular chaperone GrpE